MSGHTTLDGEARLTADDGTWRMARVSVDLIAGNVALDLESLNDYDRSTFADPKDVRALIDALERGLTLAAAARF